MPYPKQACRSVQRLCKVDSGCHPCAKSVKTCLCVPKCDCGHRKKCRKDKKKKFHGCCTPVVPDSVLSDIVVTQAVGPVHISDTSSMVVDLNNRWEARVTFTVVDSVGNPVEGAEIQADWDDASNRPSNCLTNAMGRCVLFRRFSDRVVNAFCTVTNIVHANGYDPSANENTDCDNSNGTRILIRNVPTRCASGNQFWYCPGANNPANRIFCGTLFEECSRTDLGFGTANTGMIMGTVIDTSSNPVPNANVFTPWGDRAITDSNGCYSMVAFATSGSVQYSLSAAALSYFPSVKQTAVPSGGAVTVDFTLTPV